MLLCDGVSRSVGLKKRGRDVNVMLKRNHEEQMKIQNKFSTIDSKRINMPKGLMSLYNLSSFERRRSEMKTEKACLPG